MQMPPRPKLNDPACPSSVAQSYGGGWTGRVDCNRSAMAGFAAALGQALRASPDFLQVHKILHPEFVGMVTKLARGMQHHRQGDLLEVGSAGRKRDNDAPRTRPRLPQCRGNHERLR